MCYTLSLLYCLKERSLLLVYDTILTLKSLKGLLGNVVHAHEAMMSPRNVAPDEFISSISAHPKTSPGSFTYSGGFGNASCRELQTTSSKNTGSRSHSFYVPFCDSLLELYRNQNSWK